MSDMNHSLWPTEISKEISDVHDSIKDPNVSFPPKSLDFPRRFEHHVRQVFSCDILFVVHHPIIPVYEV